MSHTKNRLRIIGGRHRGHRLQFIPGEGLRPTADRVRETVFNWLQGELTHCRVLDLFAGSGAMGFEALSRGAAEVVFVERDRNTAQQLRRNVSKLPGAEACSQVMGISAQRWLQRPVSLFDVVFLDPPFKDQLLANIVEQLESSGFLQENAWIYVEQSAQEAWPIWPDTWHWYREGSAGQAKYGLLQRQAAQHVLSDEQLNGMQD